MNFLDLIDIGAAASRRFAFLVSFLVVICFLAWPTQSFNFLHGQALDSAASSTNLIASNWGIRCTVTQDDLLSPATLDCTTGP